MADLNGATAILIGEPASDPTHLYARVKREGQANQVTPLPVALADDAFHGYRIACGEGTAEFAVDGMVRATLAASATPLVMDWARVLDYRQVEGTFTGETLDGARARDRRVMGRGGPSHNAIAHRAAVGGDVRAQSAQFGDTHAGERALPAVGGLLRDAQLAADLTDSDSSRITPILAYEAGPRFGVSQR